MKIEVLVSTMDLNNNFDLIEKMNILGNSITINQCTPSNKIKNITTGNNKLYCYNEKGLSKSRNKAIMHSSSDICVIADDDMKYNNNYYKTITNAYKKYPDADIIAFYVDDENTAMKKSKMKEGRVGYLKSMKIQSVQLTFKRKSIIDNDIRFDEKFGAGTEWYMGEENIFLFSCLKKKLKIYYVPQTIATLIDNESTWFKGYNEEYFFIKGIFFRRLSKKFYKILNLQFAIRKYKLYNKKYSFLHILDKMMKGSSTYESINKEN